MNANLSKIFICSVLSTTLFAQTVRADDREKPRTYEAFLNYVMQNIELVGGVGAIGVAVGIGVGRLMNRAAPLQANAPARQAGPLNPRDAIAVALVAFKQWLTGGAFLGRPEDGAKLLAQTDALLERLEGRTPTLVEETKPQTQTNVAGANTEYDPPLVSENVVPPLEQLEKPRNPAEELIAQQKQKLGSRRNSIRLLEEAAKPAPPIEFLSRASQLRRIGRDASGDLPRAVRAPAPLTEAQRKELAAVQHNRIEKFRDLARDLLNAKAQSDVELHRGVIMARLERISPEEIREIAEYPFFWEKLMYEREGFFQVLTAEQFEAAIQIQNEAGLTGFEVAIAHLMLKPQVEYSEGEVAKRAELVLKHLNVLTHLLKNAFDNHVAYSRLMRSADTPSPPVVLEVLKRKLKVLIAAREAFLAKLDKRLLALVTVNEFEFEQFLRTLEIRFRAYDKSGRIE